MLRALRIAWKAIAYGVAILALGVACVQAWFYAHVLWWNTHNPGSTAFMQARLEQLRQKIATRG